MSCISSRRTQSPLSFSTSYLHRNVRVSSRVLTYFLFCTDLTDKNTKDFRSEISDCITSKTGKITVLRPVVTTILFHKKEDVPSEHEGRSGLLWHRLIKELNFHVVFKSGIY